VVVCNDCGTICVTGSREEAQKRLAAMASDEMCSKGCPHCGTLNLFPGFSAMEAFVCKECGEGVQVTRPLQ